MKPVFGWYETRLEFIKFIKVISFKNERDLLKVFQFKATARIISNVPLSFIKACYIHYGTLQSFVMTWTFLKWKLSELNTLKLVKQWYLSHYWSEKGLKGTIVNQHNNMIIFPICWCEIEEEVSKREKYLNLFTHYKQNYILHPLSDWKDFK